MKKIMLFAAACTVLAACNKNIDTVNPVDAPTFEKGQKVTLTVGTDNQTKVSSALDASSGAVDFKWESGDQIKVTVGSNSANFTLKTGAGESTATFEGTMPEGGNTFDVQYPVDDPDLTSQTYVANALPQDKMLFKATGCSISQPSFTLAAQYAALRINLWGSKTIGKIEVVKVGTTDPSYTLNCGTGVTTGATKADSTAFFVVVPAGSYKFSAEVFDNAQTPASICKFQPGADKTFTAGEILNMPAKEVKPIVAVTGIQLASSSTGLIDGSNAVDAPAVTFTPSNATDQTCTWTSNDTGVVTVDSETGALTAVGTGETTVTVTANGGYGVSTTLNVTVIGTTIEIYAQQLAAANSWEDDGYYTTANYGSFTFSISGTNSGQYYNESWAAVMGGETLSISSSLFNITKAVINDNESIYAFSYENGIASYWVVGQAFIEHFTLTLSAK